MDFFVKANGRALCEIRWHGRGGQGAITSAQHLALAAYFAGFRGVTSAPSFGAERRGAPVTASTRLSHEPVRVFSQIETPDAVVVLDETLLECADVAAGLGDEGWLIINSPREPDALGIEDRFSVATADASGVARETGLVIAGAEMVNTAMLGAFARATGLIELEHIHAAFAARFKHEAAELNFEAAKLAYERTKRRTAARIS